MEQEIMTGVIEETLRLFVKADAITELRIVDGPYGRPVSGYFDPGHLANAAKEAAKLTERCTAVYFVPNPVKPELLARAANRIQERPKQTTSDHDIRERCWLYIDLDPKRAAGISSTDLERDAAFALTDEVERYLRREGWPSPVLADSGNGFHLVYRIELPNDEPARLLVEGVLKALDFLFSNEQVVVDTANGNAARIWKLYGTLARKGDQTSDRPHRPSSIVLAPEGLEPVPTALLERLAGLVPKPPPRGPTSGQMRFDLAGWIRSHVDVAFEGPWQAGYRWILRHCPWNSDHTNRSAYILQFPSGAISAGCRHDGCKDKRWSDLRIKLDPEYARRVEEKFEPQVIPINGTKPKRRASRVFQEQDMKHVEWLWPGYLPLGKICDLQGDPGRGKSLLTAQFAAAVTGGIFPDGSAPGIEGGSVLIASAEDDASDTIVPRLVAAGADLSKVYIRTILDEPLLTLPEDLPLLVDDIRDFNIRLLVFDPLDAFLSDDIDANKNQSIRRLLAQLARTAAEHKCTVLLLRHLNKDAKISNPMYRGGGSIGLNAAAREVLLVGGAPNDTTLQVLAPVKANLAVTPPSLGYRIKSATVESKDGPIEIATVEWVGPVAFTGRDLLEEPEPKRGRKAGSGDKLNQVMEILDAMFKDGAAHSSDEAMEEIARHGQFSEGTITKARKLLGIQARKNTFKGGWKWIPPGADEGSIEVDFTEGSLEGSEGSESSDDPPF